MNKNSINSNCNYSYIENYNKFWYDLLKASMLPKEIVYVCNSKIGKLEDNDIDFLNIFKKYNLWKK